jgi:uncharacterized protein YukE
MSSGVTDPGLLMMNYDGLGDAYNQLGSLHNDLVQRFNDLISRANTISQGNRGLWVGRGAQTFERAFAADFAALQRVLNQLEAAHALLPQLTNTVQEADAQASALFQRT